MNKYAQNENVSEIVVEEWEKWERISARLGETIYFYLLFGIDFYCAQ